MKTSVYITVDTESSMGGAWHEPGRRPLPASRHVFCRNEHGEFGLPLIVNELRQAGLRATFFCETLSTHVLGEADTRSITDFLCAAGQDVQLHLHPTYRHYADALRRDAVRPADTAPGRDDLAAHSEAEQLALVSEASELLTRCTGRVPIAFRAGNFAANRTTLGVLRKLGILIDSSFNPAYVGRGSFDAEPLRVNVPQQIDGVFELPITVARTRLPEGNGFKPFDPGALSMWEMERILSEAHGGGSGHVVVIFHCFSTVKPKDPYYSAFRPNWIMIRRLRWLLAFLASNSTRFGVRTIGELAEEEAPLASASRSVIPSLGLWHPAARKAIQALNRLYWT